MNGRKAYPVNITVQGDMIGNTIGLGAVLDTLGAKAPQLGFDTADGAQFQNAFQEARVNPPQGRGTARSDYLRFLPRAPESGWPRWCPHPPGFSR